MNAFSQLTRQRVLRAAPLVLLLAFAGLLSAQESENRSVLFIGNSMIGRTMSHLSKITETAGQKWKITPFTRGGARLESFTDQNPERDALAKIAEGGFTNVVFVQGTAFWFEGPPKNSLNRDMAPADREMTAQKTIDAAAKLHEQIAKIGARTVLYLGYPHMPADERTPEQFAHLDSIHWKTKDQLDAMKIEDETHPVLLVPVGVLWMRGADQFGADVWYKDDRHGSDRAYFANAMLFYACMSGGDPGEITYDGGLPADQVAWVKEQAWNLSKSYRRP